MLLKVEVVSKLSLVHAKIAGILWPKSLAKGIFSYILPVEVNQNALQPQDSNKLTRYENRGKYNI